MSLYRSLWGGSRYCHSSWVKFTAMALNDTGPWAFKSLFLFIYLFIYFWLKFYYLTQGQSLRPSGLHLYFKVTIRVNFKFSPRLIFVLTGSEFWKNYFIKPAFSNLFGGWRGWVVTLQTPSSWSSRVVSSEWKSGQRGQDEGVPSTKGVFAAARAAFPVLCLGFGVPQPREEAGETRARPCSRGCLAWSVFLKTCRSTENRGRAWPAYDLCFHCE